MTVELAGYINISRLETTTNTNDINFSMKDALCEDFKDALCEDFIYRATLCDTDSVFNDDFITEQYDSFCEAYGEEAAQSFLDKITDVAVQNIKNNKNMKIEFSPYYEDDDIFLGYDYVVFFDVDMDKIIDEITKKYENKMNKNIDLEKWWEEQKTKDLTRWWEDKKSIGWLEKQKATGCFGSNGVQEDRIICGFKKEDELTIAKAFREFEEKEFAENYHNRTCWWIDGFKEGDNGLCMLSYGTVKDYDNALDDYLCKKLNLNNSVYAFYINYGSNDIWRDFNPKKCSLVSFSLCEYDMPDEPHKYFDTDLILKDNLTGIEFQFGAGGCVYYEDVQNLLNEIELIKKADNYKKPNAETIECIDIINHLEEYDDYE